MLNATGIKAVDDREHRRLGRNWLNYNRSDYSPGSSIFFGNFGQSAREEKGSVEIEDRDLPADDREPEFSSKVEESIWRLRNKK